MYLVSDSFRAALLKPVINCKLTGTIGSVAFTENNLVRGSFRITNQCTNSNDVTLGLCNIGQLEGTFTGVSLSYFAWLNKKITVSVGLEIAADTWEYVPLGTFKIKEAKHTAEGVAVVAYDNMIKFDKKIKKSHFKNPASMYEHLDQICDDCHVTLGMSENQINAMVTGSGDYTVYGYQSKEMSNDIETYRDLLYWIAQAMGCFATINRSGELVLRVYSNTVPVDTISDSYRLSGAQFNDTITAFTGVYFEDLDTGDIHYYGKSVDGMQSEKTALHGVIAQAEADIAELDEQLEHGEITQEEYDAAIVPLMQAINQANMKITKLTEEIAQAQEDDAEGTDMDCGANPLLMNSNEATRTTQRTNVLNALENANFTPFQSSTIFGIHYDLGDCIYCTGGHAGSGQYVCVMAYDWTYNAEYSMQGFGSEDAQVKCIIKSKSEKAAKSATNSAATAKQIADSKPDITVSSSDPVSGTGKTGDLHVKNQKEGLFTIGAWFQYAAPNPAERGYAFQDVQESVGDNGYTNLTCNLKREYNEECGFPITGLTVGKDYYASCNLQVLGDPTLTWGNNAYNCVFVSDEQAQEEPNPGDRTPGYYFSNGHQFGVTQYYKETNCFYFFKFTATQETMYLKVCFYNYKNGEIDGTGGVDRGIAWTNIKVTDGKKNASSVQYNENGDWSEPDYIKGVDTGNEGASWSGDTPPTSQCGEVTPAQEDSVSEVGLEVTSEKKLKLKPNVMRAWIKSGPPAKKRTFNQFCARYSGKVDSSVELKNHSGNVWDAISYTKLENGTYKMKCGGNVAAAPIEYYAYKITGLTQGTRYYFNFAAKWGSGTTFEGNYKKGCGVVFNTTGTINTDSWSGKPDTFNESTGYCSFVRATYKRYYDCSFVASASTMYMVVTVGDLLTQDDVTLTFSDFVISKGEREVIRDIYLYDTVPDDWLHYEPIDDGAGGGGGGASNLSELDDVVITSPAEDDVLMMGSASKWVNTAWSTFRAKLKTYFDTIYSTFSGAYADLSGKPTLGTAAAKDTTNSYSSSGTDPITGTGVAAAMGTLDVTGASNIAASKTIKAWSETDGKVSITTQDISITKSQVSDFPTIPPELDGQKTLTGNPITFSDGSESYASALTVRLEPKQAGSGTPSPTNIRPITGYTECNVGDVGINRWDGVWESGYYDANGNAVSSGSNFRSVNYTKVEPNTSYYFVTGTAGQGRYCYYDKNKQFISRSDLFNGNTALTIPSNCYYVRFHFDGSSPNDVGINYPSTATTYEPYKSSNATISFGQEVYGCDVDMLTGKVVVDRAVTTKTWSDGTSVTQLTNNTRKMFGTLSDSLPGNSEISDKLPMIVNYIQDTPHFYIDSNSKILVVFMPTNTSESEQFSICYKLATPITLQLTPAELKLLKEQNTVTTNGTTITLSYQPNNPLGDTLQSAEEYTDRHFAWKKVGEYDTDGQDIVINGDYSEIMIVPYGVYPSPISTMAELSVIYPFELFGVCTLTFLWSYSNGDYQSDGSILPTKKLNGNHSVMIFVR